MTPRFGRAAFARLPTAVVASLALSGCGYAAVHSGQAGFCVTPGESRAADTVATSALASGVREGLASTGGLGKCPPARRVRVEIVRISASPMAFVQAEDGVAARGMQVSVVARATVEVDDESWTAESEGEGLIEVSRSVGAAAQSEADARSRAARQAGLGLAAMLSGAPAPSQGRGTVR